MASYTVNFTDGSSHTYDNVPETVTEDQVRARASDEYGNKEISHVDGDVASSAAPAAPAGPAIPDNQPNLAEKGVAAAQTAFNTLKPVAHYAMSHPIETAAVGSYVPGVNQLPGFRDVTAARKALYDRYIGQSQTLNALKSAPTPPPEVPPVGGAPAQQICSYGSTCCSGITRSKQNDCTSNDSKRVVLHKS